VDPGNRSRVNESPHPAKLGRGFDHETHQATGAGAGDRPAQPRRRSAVGQQRRRHGQCPGPHHPDARAADLPGPHQSEKRYVFGKQQVTIRPASAWNFLLTDRPDCEAIRALTWLGPDQASAALPTLRSTIPPEEWRALVSVCAELPLWLAKLLSEAAPLALEVRG